MRISVWCSSVLVLAVCAPLCVGQAGSSTSAAPAQKAPCEKLASLKLPDANVATAEVAEAAISGAAGPIQRGRTRLRCTRICRHSAGWLCIRILRRIRIFRLRSGCRWRDGTEGCWVMAMVVLRDRLVTRIWARRWRRAMRRRGPIRATAASFIDARWALGHPEKVADFGYRAIHEMTVTAKVVVEQFYGAAAKHSYFASCSDGGREALMEAQRFPEDYDGILAGAPANNWTALLATAAVDTQALTAKPGSFIPPAKVPAIAKAVLARVRCAGWGEGRDPERSAAMPLRSGDDGVQGGRGHQRLPDCGPGDGAEGALCRCSRCEGARRFFRDICPAQKRAATAGEAGFLGRRRGEA